MRTSASGMHGRQGTRCSFVLLTQFPFISLASFVPDPYVKLKTATERLLDSFCGIGAEYRRYLYPDHGKEFQEDVPYRLYMQIASPMPGSPISERRVRP